MEMISSRNILEEWVMERGNCPMKMKMPQRNEKLHRIRRFETGGSKDLKGPRSI